ncbi:MAG: hypothetical protein IPJ26_16990 [Bacteroidetes bacterium]|nr:hypothetical protein [Bacteroidota bacterium]
MFSKLLDIDKNDETISFSDFEKLDFPNINTFKTAIKGLEKLGLVTTVVDENDSRRKSIQVLPKGYFFAYALKDE